jgi:hypothetical protein
MEISWLMTFVIFKLMIIKIINPDSFAFPMLFTGQGYPPGSADPAFRTPMNNLCSLEPDSDCQRPRTVLPHSITPVTRTHGSSGADSNEERHPFFNIIIESSNSFNTTSIEGKWLVQRETVEQIGFYADPEMLGLPYRTVDPESEQRLIPGTQDREFSADIETGYFVPENMAGITEPIPIYSRLKRGIVPG